MTQTNLLTCIVIVSLALLTTNKANGQDESNGTTLEFSAGMKTAFPELTYGKTFWYNTARGGFALQPSLRADLHLVLFYIRDQDISINLMGQTGIMQYLKAKKFDYVAVEPFTHDTLRYTSKNPTYFPLYLGFYSPYSFFIGFEAFYYKGLGVEDLYGFKLLSLGYNAHKFRVGAALEMYDQVHRKAVVSNQAFFSFEFLWKLRPREE